MHTHLDESAREVHVGLIVVARLHVVLHHWIGLAVVAEIAQIHLRSREGGQVWQGQIGLGG